MLTTVLLVLILLIVGFSAYKNYMFQRKMNNLYDYFIKSENDSTQEELLIKGILRDSGLPPINGDCPTKEELRKELK